MVVTKTSRPIYGMQIFLPMILNTDMYKICSIVCIFPTQN